MDFYGPPVNRAARIEGQAEGGQVLICETTHQHCFGAGARRLTALQSSASSSSFSSAVASPLLNDFSDDAAAADAAAAKAAAAIGSPTSSSSSSTISSSSLAEQRSLARSGSVHDPALHAHLAPSEALMAATIVKDLGVRELKGISKAEHIYEVRSTSFFFFPSFLILILTSSSPVLVS